MPPEKPIKEDTGKGSLPATSLIDTYSSRRRSTATCSLENTNTNASTKMPGQWLAKEPEHINFLDVNSRLLFSAYILNALAQVSARIFRSVSKIKMPQKALKTKILI